MASRSTYRLFSSARRYASSFAADAGQAEFGAHSRQQASGIDGRSALKKWGTRLAIAVALPTIYVTGAIYPPRPIAILFPRSTPPAPKKDSRAGKHVMDSVEIELQGLDIVNQMRNREGWYESRPYKNYDPQKVHNSLTAGTLRGPGMFAVPPMAFAKDDESEAVVILHVGRAMCGHDGIVHGGLLATIFDESLARNALLNFDSNIGVTAKLSINYKSPTMADQFVVVRTKLDALKGRKANVSATMETLDGEQLATASALFIEPKWAQFLQSSGVTEALGQRRVPVPLENEAPERAV